MIPTQQTKFGNGNGNCLLACVASILHRPIEEIPDFSLSGAGWYDELYEWCRNEEIGLIQIEPGSKEPIGLFHCYAICIFTVPGFDENHAVIGKCVRTELGNPDALDGLTGWHWECVPEFDPNPKGVNVGEMKHMIILVPPICTRFHEDEP